MWIVHQLTITFLSGDDDDDDDSDSDSSSSEKELDNKKEEGTGNVANLLEKARIQAEQQGESLEDKISKMIICCGCLGDRSDDTNEIVECDGCGVTVHEGIYSFFYFVLIFNYFLS